MTDLLPVAPGLLAAAFVITTVAATLQGTIGFGFAILSVPTLALIDPRLAPVPQMFAVTPLVLRMAWRERHAIDVRGVVWIVAGRFPGAGLGVLLVAIASPATLDFVIGGIVLFAVAALSTGSDIPRNRFTQLVAGTASGLMSYVSAIGGPALAVIYRDTPGETMRSSLAAVFCIGLVVTISARLATGQVTGTDIHVALCLLPAIGLGLLFSRGLTGRVEGKGLRTAILVVSTFAAIGLFLRSW